MFEAGLRDRDTGSPEGLSLVNNGWSCTTPQANDQSRQEAPLVPITILCKEVTRACAFEILHSIKLSTTWPAKFSNRKKAEPSKAVSAFQNSEPTSPFPLVALVACCWCWCWSWCSCSRAPKVHVWLRYQMLCSLPHHSAESFSDRVGMWEIAGILGNT